MRKIGVIIIIIIAALLVLTVLFHTGVINLTLNKSGDESRSMISPSAISENEEQTASPTPEIVEETIILDDGLLSADNLLQQDIQAGFPGAVLLVAVEGEIIFLKSYGNLKIYDGFEKLEEPVQMRTDTVFDLASLTKVYATLLSIMKLYDSNLISLDQPVYEILPEFNKEPYNQITVRQLLNHTSGFPSDVKFFRPDNELGEAFYSTVREKTVSLLSEIPLVAAPGERAEYSDIGYMVLGAVVEKISGMDLNEFADKYIYSPLYISQSMGFLPLFNGFDINNIACTERNGNTRDGLQYFPEIRTYTLQGEVHDEKAYYSMDGVSGHAGLFSDAQSVNVLNQLLLNDGTYANTPIFSPETVETFTSVDSSLRYQLGFSDASQISSLDGIVPAGTLSHTGWTGTFSLIDPQNNISIVLLTNKRHSPITDGEFEGALYDTGKYFAVVAKIYEALNLT